MSSASSQTPTTRAERSEQTRQALLASAQDAFLEQGVDGASVERIAQGAGYTKGAFYAQFESKRDLVLALLEERFGDQIARFGESLAGISAPGDEARAAAGDFIENTVSDRAWTSLFMQFAALAARDEEFRLAFVERYKQHQHQLATLLERWNPELAKASGFAPDDVSLMIFALGNGFILERLVDPTVEDARFSDAIFVYLRGLEAIAAERGAGPGS